MAWIYRFLDKDGKPLYIGQTTRNNLSERFADHNHVHYTMYLQIAKIEYMAVPKNEVTKTERYLIEHHDPQYNKERHRWQTKLWDEVYVDDWHEWKDGAFIDTVYTPGETYAPLAEKPKIKRTVTRTPQIESEDRKMVRIGNSIVPLENISHISKNGKNLHVHTRDDKPYFVVCFTSEQEALQALDELEKI